jgi:hypothetical protein
MTVEGLGYTIICAVFGIVSIVYGLYLRRKLGASANWSQSIGTIRSAEVGNNAAADSVEYEVLVSYEYVVNGTSFTGKRIEFGRRGYLKKRRAEEQLARYPVQSSVMVFFNPENPQDAVLELQASGSATYFILGVLAFGFAVTIFVLTHRRS